MMPMLNQMMYSKNVISLQSSWSYNLALAVCGQCFMTPDKAAECQKYVLAHNNE